MGKHSATTRVRRAPRGRHAAAPAAPALRRSSGTPRSSSSATRKLLLGSLALGASVAVMIGGQGSLAFWTDSATVSTGGFTAGKLDLTVDGAQSVTAKTGLSLSNMVPGESVAANLTLANAGNADFTWTPTVTKGTTDLGPALQVELFVGGADSGEDTSYPRTEGCTGGTLLASGTQAASPIRIAGSQVVCVKVTLPTNTGDAFQGLGNGTATISIAAQQVANP